MRDFRRGWKRWTRREQVAFVVLALAMMATVPASLGASIRAAPGAAIQMSERL